MSGTRDSDLRTLDLFAPTPEHALLGETLREFVKREVEPQAAAHDRAERFNLPLFRKAGELGLLGVTLPEEYGGAGLDAVAAVQVCEALSTADPGFALSVLAHAILFAQNLSVNGSELQKKSLLPRAATGALIGGLCMTEPSVGTDVLRLRTRARREGDEYVLDGVKTFITNGGIDDTTLGDAFIVYAVTDDGQISSFLVEKGAPGFRLGQKWKDKLGMRASFTAELVFEGVRVPPSSRMGEEGEGHTPRDAEPGGRAAHARRHVGGHRRALSRGHGGLRERTQELRRAAARSRSISVTSRRASPVRAAPDVRLRRGPSHGSGRRRAARGRRRCEALRRPGGKARGRCRDPGPRRVWIHGRIRGRTPVATPSSWEIGGGTLEASAKNLMKDLSRDPTRIRS